MDPFDHLPPEIIWKWILPYCPCFGLTPTILQEQKLQNRTISILKRNIRVPPEEAAMIERRIRRFDCRANKIFEYISSSVFLTIFYRNPRYDDYIVIFL